MDRGRTIAVLSPCRWNLACGDISPTWGYDVFVQLGEVESSTDINPSSTHGGFSRHCYLTMKVTVSIRQMVAFRSISGLTTLAQGC